MKRITTARVREYALLPVTAGRAVALATVPTMMFCLSPLSRALADDYFDPAALEFADPQQQTSDLHYFAKPGGQQPGTYSVTVVVNDQELGQADITFVDDGGQLRPVLTPGQLAEYGVNVSAFPAFQALHEGETFTRIEKFIPDASSRFSFANQRLTLSIPQAAMNVQSRGYVDPSRWDDGVPAAFVDYYFSGAQIKNADEGESSRSNYLNLRSGLNLGAWRLRNISSMQYDQQRRHWDTQSTWLQRDVRSLKSLLRIGDTYTTGDVFDSIQFRGVQLMSDDEMLPDSQRGFAPTIRGVAHSNAKVTVSQHGYVIYETFVSPGAFAISDLYPTSQSGDLEVKVTESNGAVPTRPNLFYSVQQGYGNQGRGSNSSASLDYHGGFGNAQIGYRHDAASNQLTWGGAGSVVAHPHGVTFGQTVGESFAIVRAPGAAGVAVQNGNNVHTDWRGYAVVPSLTAYRKNVITLDTESMADDTDVDQQGQTVIPGGGAVVMANYQTHIGNRVLFTLRNAQGPLPFGASARLVKEEESGNPPGGMVADGGQVYLSGVPQEGTLAVSWIVNNQSQSCTLHFHLPDNPQQSLNTVKTVSGLCQTR
ncbi:TPA: fimbrial biogenesis outer membrane usher protein [Klebsiella pneumoniae]|nr:fimbrial biogenesis outer membrane usher protein [Klebsiella pneumoniae]